MKILNNIINKLKKYIIETKWRYYEDTVRKQAKRVGEGLHVHGKSFVTRNTVLGKHVCFNGMDIRGNGKVYIGNYFHSGSGCKMITDVHNYDKGTQIPYDSTYIVKDIKIGQCVWLGVDVLILGGVTIGEGAIIQAGSVVVSDIPPCAIAGGAPAKVFKYRDKEHYYDLKAKKKYH